MNKYIPTKEELTNHQLGPVLAVMRELQPFLLEEVVEPGGTPTARALTGEVSLAASTTFIKACSRIDSILEDSGRWTLKPHTDLIAELVKTHKAQQKFIEVQTAASAMIQTPHYMLRPTIATMGDNYVAYWGNISEAGQAICGVGGTPGEALLDFDKAFERAPQRPSCPHSRKGRTRPQPTTRPTDRMKNNLLIKIKIPQFAKLRAWLVKHKPTVATRKKIIYKFLRSGTTAIGWLALRLTRLLFWRLSDRSFIGTVAMHWTFKPVYSDKIAGIDKALKERYSPEESLDRLKAEHETLNSFIQYDNE